MTMADPYNPCTAFSPSFETRYVAPSLIHPSSASQLLSQRIEFVLSTLCLQRPLLLFYLQQASDFCTLSP
jgi:hypothetical protein